MAQKNRNNETREVLERLHHDKGEAFILSELVQITAQVDMEAEEKKFHSLFELFIPRYVRRTATSMLLMTLTQLTVAGVIQAYQGILYNSLSFSGSTVLLISGCYGIMGVIGQALNLWFVADKWPRVRTLGKLLTSKRHSPMLIVPSHRVYRPSLRALYSHGSVS